MRGIRSAGLGRNRGSSLKYGGQDKIHWEGGIWTKLEEMLLMWIFDRRLLGRGNWQWKVNSHVGKTARS